MMNKMSQVMTKKGLQDSEGEDKDNLRKKLIVNFGHRNMQ
jgi:hypothetical protein